MLLAHLLAGYDWRVALGFTASSIAASWLVRPLLVRGLDGRRAALLDQGDVSRLIGAIALSSLVAGAGCGLTAWATGNGSPWLGSLGAFGATAAALMILLPLFLETLRFEPLASTRERIIQGVLTLGTTTAVFASTDAPLVIFAVMPMFAWHAFRGTLREATILLTVVGVIGTVMTEVVQVGPIYALGDRYGIAPELASGVLQLFLVDCGLILLPLSVIVTQQRIATARADSERETLQRLVEAATGTAIIAIGVEGRIVLFNPGAEAMLGYLAEEVIGELPDQFHPPGELRRQASRLRALPNFSDICRASVEAGERNQLWRFRRKHGEERTMRMTLTAVHGARGELTGYLATAEDVTEREDAQRALLLTLEHQRTAVERLRELERVKGDFVSTVSHELRTPITSIIGYTELLGEGAVGELTLSQQEIIDRVDRNGRRLLLLVEDLLTLSQIESSVLKIEPVVTDVRNVVTNAHEAIGSRPGRPLAGRDRAGADPAGRPPRRPRAARADGRQPAHQRGEVHPRRRPGRAAAAHPEREHRDRHQGHRHGHPGGGAVEAVHPVLPLLDRDRAGHPGHRARPDHRQGDRGPARRADLGAVGAPVRHHRDGEPAAPAGPRAPAQRDRLRPAPYWPCYWAATGRGRRAGRPRRRAPARCSPSR